METKLRRCWQNFEYPSNKLNKSIEQKITKSHIETITTKREKKSFCFFFFFYINTRIEVRHYFFIYILLTTLIFVFGSLYLYIEYLIWAFFFSSFSSDWIRIFFFAGTIWSGFRELIMLLVNSLINFSILDILFHLKKGSKNIDCWWFEIRQMTEILNENEIEREKKKKKPNMILFGEDRFFFVSSSTIWFISLRNVFLSE